MSRIERPGSIALIALFWAVGVVAALGVYVSSAQAVAPSIAASPFPAKLTAETAKLEAQVNPGSKLTRYHFEWGPAGCAFPCNVTPEAPFPSIGAGSVPVPVEATLTDLSPGTAYHFHVVAENSSGTVPGPEIEFITYQLPQSFGPCPNEGFRSGQPSGALPDCRAYEQASPVDKNGLDVTGTYPTTKASVNGDAIGFAAASPLPGGQGAQDVSLSLARRNQNDWSTQGLLPPQSFGQRAGIVGWTTDFATVFDRAVLFGEPETVGLFARESGDGSLSPITPYGAMGLTHPSPYFFVGASVDGSKVFFEVLGEGPDSKLTPEAIEGRDNLYVFDRDAETISLVGVLSDSDCESTPPCAPPGGSFAGPYDWASGESKAALSRGGAEQFYYLQEQRAISEDGSRAYFTAADSGQLYLRTDPAGAGASTDHISASEKENGTGPDGTDAAGTRPAAFMAASKDGKVALFTSSEKLTDDATTGPEPDHPPAIARADASGAPASIDIDFLPTSAFSVAVDAAHIYWTDPKAGMIGRANLDGTDPDPEFILNAGSPHYLAVDATHIYWSNAGDEADEEGTIARAEIDGKNPDLDFIEGANNPRGVALDGTYVYWANAGDPQGDSEAAVLTRSIGRAKLNGEEANQGFIQVDFGLQKRRPQGIAVDNAHIYWTLVDTSASGGIQRRDIDGDAGSQITIFDVLNSKLGGIALDAGHVYWVREGKDSIGRAALDLSSPEPVFIQDAGQPGGVASDGAHLYWSANQEVQPNPGNDLYRYDATTGKLSDLVVDVVDKNGADVRGVLGTSEDASRVYFAANGVLTNQPNEEGETAQPGDCEGATLQGEDGTCNLYLAQGEAITFVALVEGDMSALQGTPNWAPSPRSVAVDTNRYRKSSHVSADGRTLLFASRLQLSDYDNEGQGELYRYRQGEGIVCVSCSPTAAPPAAVPAAAIQPPVLIPQRPASVLSRALSSDGNRVFFESTDALVEADVNGREGCPPVGQWGFPGCQDVYEWEAAGTGSCESTQNGCLYLLSSGTSDYASFFLDASASGEDVFIVTRTAGLVRQDGDELLDVYDVRVDGGLSSQNQASDICQGTSECQGQVKEPEALPIPPTESSPGEAPLHPKRSHCAKKRGAAKKGKARCSKPHKKGAQHKKGRAGKTRRSSK